MSTGPKAGRPAFEAIAKALYALEWPRGTWERAYSTTRGKFRRRANEMRPFIDAVNAVAAASALRAAADAWLARDIHDDLCDYGPPGTCPCSLGEVYRWLRDRADEIDREVSDGPR